VGAIIEARGLAKTFLDGEEAVQALRGVSLQLETGEFLAVLGPSGAGKTTLLNLIGGLEPVTAGSILIEGVELSGLSDNELTLFRRRRAGFIFQALNLLPNLTVFENTALPFILEGRTAPQDQDRVFDLLELVGLRGREKRKATELSTGEQQRVAVARALLAEPAIVIADEPTGMLDSARGVEILQLLWESCDNFKQTILLVTNHPRIAAFADRVLFLRDGELLDELILGRREDHHDARPILDRFEKLGL
jgi:putative ABC transport system ATP-binding protein